MRKRSLGIYHFFCYPLVFFCPFLFFLVCYINITMYTVNKLYNMVVYSVLLGEVFLWYMLRPLTCNPQGKKRENLGWILFVIGSDLPFPILPPSLLLNLPTEENWGLRSGSVLGIRVGEPPDGFCYTGPCSGGRDPPPTWKLSGKLQAADKKKAKRRFTFLILPLWEICVTFLRAAWLSVCVCIYLISLTKFLVFIDIFLFKIISIIYTILSFFTMYRSAKKVDFCPVLPRRYLQKGITSFFIGLTHTLFRSNLSP